MVFSTVTYNYAGIFSQYMFLNNYIDIFNERSFPFLTLCERNEYKLFIENKVQVLCRLIACYNITMGHQLMGLVCTVDSSTFHGLIHQE